MRKYVYMFGSFLYYFLYGTFLAVKNKYIFSFVRISFVSNLMPKSSYNRLTQRFVYKEVMIIYFSNVYVHLYDCAIYC